MELTILASTAAGVKGAALITAAGTVVAAVLIGVCGGLITSWYNRQKDRQEKELQYRSHAIELAKLDHERKLKLFEKDPDTRMRPGILDFLANYRDLKELDSCTPAQLYAKIKQQRIATSAPADTNRPEI